ncbi:pantoate--beta-alanine ligase [Uliginosibacterium sp. H3]|uniref:Pantothenate synthetase n=1 Tax=Uliginosibacterium silvisoli TaxID=3114758 RepID=A0ABU6K609_9RHOO|nr:pantoate--beta-alanine ligase [Uliginosibacterium sp. H3]
MQIHTSIESLRSALRNAGKVAFAPTMGNLHAGHISLMRQAQDHGDCVVSSIFVNRLQFGPREDFDKYPRTFDADCQQLHAAGVAHLFAPDETVLYPTPQQYFVLPAETQDSILEGAARPGHFRGVATVVTKLLNIVQPDTVLLGKKDYQQLMVIRNMVRELNMPIEVIGCDTVRAEDGLALSSRNGYLSMNARAEAPRLFAQLQVVARAIQSGQTDFATLEAAASAHLYEHGWHPDYISVRRQADLLPPSPGDALVIVAAARLENTRLLDNLEVSLELSPEVA